MRERQADIGRMISTDEGERQAEKQGQERHRVNNVLQMEPNRPALLCLKEPTEQWKR